MIVYGDPQHEELLDKLVTRLKSHLADLVSGQDPGGHSLDLLRVALIFSGQVEQALHDSLGEPTQEDGDVIGRVLSEEQALVSLLHNVTSELARAFYARWVSEGDSSTDEEVRSALARAIGGPVNLEQPGRLVTVKTPEGFAFYSLYPEQYCLSAEKWLADHANEPRRAVVVVGVRSIGTTLAAVVTEVLRAAGWEAHSFTVRPGGHPFRRSLEIPPASLRNAELGLVVDEGPGLSGSSMAAVAQALANGGVRREHISFFPAHPGEPGSEATESVRDWWATTPRYVASLDELRFDGIPLPEALVARTALLVGVEEASLKVDHVGGGLWRNLVYADASRWPPACAAFERLKYRCSLPGGAAVLWKFEGLVAAPDAFGTVADAAFREMSDHYEKGFGPRPLAVAHGFVGAHWVEGAPLGREDAGAETLRHVGRYIAEVAGLPLSGGEQRAGVDRLLEMLYWNTWEALGEDAAKRTRRWSNRSLTPGTGGAKSYGDGRMAPHEWVQTPDGGLIKVDGVGHRHDHTVVGPQPVAWDLAGAIVEWGLEDAAATILLDAFLEAGGEPVQPDTLAFYLASYAAFRAGMCHLCAQMSAYDPPEQERLQRAYRGYRERLARLLGEA